MLARVPHYGGITLRACTESSTTYRAISYVWNTRHDSLHKPIRCVVSIRLSSSTQYLTTLGKSGENLEFFLDMLALLYIRDRVNTAQGPVNIAGQNTSRGSYNTSRGNRNDPTISGG
ncbi:hypothetical protein N7519_008669 [Penicillium mononematosum]|uniref:uncharacterized protein n=1 Tax=Penicillium mononematosum TaxID=268346 RepID=UPI002546C140|nr:uncharacterized protein N7519_008669 [Penicillium mononematosum]KAJ6178208.1 hypothetical protein N7519_008669 [Penicillium mononematosum]